MEQIPGGPDPEKASNPHEGGFEIVDASQFQNAFEKETRSGIEPLECYLSEAEDFISGHGKRNEGRSLIGEF